MPEVDWSYHRKNCNSCSKTQTFLGEHEITTKTQVDARSIPLVEADVLKLVSDVNQLFITRGTKVLHYDLKKEHPDQELLLELMMGRSGKLRAPTIKVGKTLVVGFDQSTYEQVLG